MEIEIIRSRRKTVAAEIRGGRVLVRVPLRMSREEISLFIRKHEEWIRTRLAESVAREKALESLPRFTPEEIRVLALQAAEAIPARVAYYAPRIGVRPGRITIRRQRSRWGSCSAAGNLSFNCLLMRTPPGVLDSVVVHELCHLKEMNHSPRFYAEVYRVFPDYEVYRKWLKENGPLLIARLP